MPEEGSKEILEWKHDIEQEDDLIGSADEDDSGDSDEDDVNRYWPPPCSQRVQLTASSKSKTISALAFNHAGTRFASGAHDYEVRLWDFEAMDPHRPDSINNVQPSGQVVIKHLDFSINGELVLVISGSCQAVILSKDGTNKNQPTCPKGDQYIQDMAKTKGHVQMLNDGSWSPRDRNEFITCSNDATIRLWDLNKMSQQKTVIKTRSPMNGLKAIPNVCKYSRDAQSIIAGCNDGSIMLWDTRRKYLTTSSCIKNAHLKGSEITGIDYCYTNAAKIVSRSEDESCKVWDLRQLKQSLASRNGLTTLHPSTDCCFSPDDKFVLTGTSHSKNEPGQLHFLDADDLSTRQSLDVEGASVLRVLWHPKINHIAYSCTNGQICVAYDKRRSMGGFLVDNERGMRGTKRRKKYVPMSGGFTSSTSIKIITPHALPLFRDDQSSSSSNTKRSYKPELRASDGQDGRVKPAGSTLSSYIARNIAKPIDDGSVNIRDRILRHATEAERDPLWITSSGGGGGSGGAHATAQKDPEWRPQQQQQPSEGQPQQEQQQSRQQE